MKAPPNSTCVEHSPRNSARGEDERWGDWYANGLAAALDRCSAFVAVVDYAWDSSTWMAIEADLATKRLASALMFWNPDEVNVTAAGMKPYLRDELPAAVEQAIAEVVRRSAG